MPRSKRPKPSEVREGLRFVARIQDAIPNIWRVFDASMYSTLGELHCALTDMFGWNDSHLHEFTLDVPVPYQGRLLRAFVPCSPPLHAPSDGVADWQVTLADLRQCGSASLRVPIPADPATQQPRQPGGQLPYRYDFGDGWTVILTVLRSVEVDGRGIWCRKGQRSGPPDDVGGIIHFNHSIAGMLPPPRQEDIREWLAAVHPGWNPDTWSLERVPWSNPQHRLRPMLTHIRQSGLLPSPNRIGPTAIRDFAQQYPDRVTPVVEQTATHLARLVVVRRDQTLFIVQRNDLLHRPGSNPVECIARWGGPQQAAEAVILPLPHQYTLHDDARETITLPFLVIVPAAVESRGRADSRPNLSHAVGTIGPAAATDSLPASIPPLAAPNEPLIGAAVRELARVLRESPQVRQMLGLSETQGVRWYPQTG